jgi:hypothetical protein
VFRQLDGCEYRVSLVNLMHRCKGCVLENMLLRNTGCVLKI